MQPSQPDRIPPILDLTAGSPLPYGSVPVWLVSTHQPRTTHDTSQVATGRNRSRPFHADLRGRDGVDNEAAVDGVGDAAFEAAECFSAAFSFALFTVEVVPARMISAGLGNSDDVERSVESSIAAAI